MMITNITTTNRDLTQEIEAVTKKMNVRKKTETDLTKDGVRRIHGDLILSSITNQTFRVGESNVRRRGTVTLVVGDDLNAVMLPNADARVGGAEIYSDGRAFSFGGHCCTAEEEVSAK